MERIEPVDFELTRQTGCVILAWVCGVRARITRTETGSWFSDIAIDGRHHHRSDDIRFIKVLSKRQGGDDRPTVLQPIGPDEVEALVDELRQFAAAARREGITLTADRHERAADALLRLQYPTAADQVRTVRLVTEQEQTR